MTFFSWGSSIPCSHISQCWSSKARHNKCFSPRSSFHEELLLKRASLSILFAKQEQTHSNVGIMIHIEDKEQETTLLLHNVTDSILRLVTFNLRQPSPPVLLSHWAMQSERTNLALPLGQARSKMSHQPCFYTDRQIWKGSAHYQVSLLTSFLHEKRSIQPSDTGKESSGLETSGVPTVIPWIEQKGSILLLFIVIL